MSQCPEILEQTCFTEQKLTINILKPVKHLANKLKFQILKNNIGMRLDFNPTALRMAIVCKCIRPLCVWLVNIYKLTYHLSNMCYNASTYDCHMMYWYKTVCNFMWNLLLFQRATIFQLVEHASITHAGILAFRQWNYLHCHFRT